MLNIRELKKKWLSYIPHAIITISLILIISLLALFIDKKESIKSATEVKIDTLPTPIKAPLKVNKKPFFPVKKEQKVITETSVLKLEPSLNFMKKIQNSTLPYYQTEKSNYNMEKETKRIEKKIPKKVVNKPVTIKKVEIQKSRITIERRNTREDIKHIIKRFKKNNNPALSLFIAKKSYELGEYHQSYNYALIMLNYF